MRLIKFISNLFLVIFIIKAMTMNAFAVEITPYEVEKKITDNIEIRYYKKLLLATTKQSNKSQNGLFRSLFKFISGKNSENQEIKMTAPVFQEEIGSEMLMSFAMPAKYSKSNLPTPDDQNIIINNYKDKRFIAIRFSGRSNDKNFAKYQKIVEQVIKEKKLKVKLSNPIKAYYNHPWTLPIFKRNEVLFEIIK